MESKPTILFVHGSWHTPVHFRPIRLVFEHAGYQTSCPRLPSVGALPPVSMIDDARRITDELVRLVDIQNKNVAIVAHSYGGPVATQAAEERFSKASRDSNGKEGGLIRIIYLAAPLVPVDASLLTPLGGVMPPFINVDEQGMCMLCDPADKLYHDLLAEEQVHWINELRRIPASTQTMPISQASYTCYPISYIYCARDRALPYSAQQDMVADVSEKYGLIISTDTLLAGHSPYLSMPGELLKAVENQLRG